MSLRSVWRLKTHHQDSERIFKWSLEKNVVALGWNAVGDLIKFESARAICEAVRAANPSARNISRSGPQLWSFCHDIKVGDLVILSGRKPREAVVEITGPYTFAEDVFKDDWLYAHRRASRPVKHDADALWQAAGGKHLAPGQNIRWALVRCREQVDLSLIFK